MEVEGWNDHQQLADDQDGKFYNTWDNLLESTLEPINTFHEAANTRSKESEHTHQQPHHLGAHT
jgi:hypothetical protein